MGDDTSNLVFSDFLDVIVPILTTSPGFLLAEELLKVD